MCKIPGEAGLEGQKFLAPNRFVPVKNGFRSFALRRRMECIRTGAKQVILDTFANTNNNGSNPIEEKDVLKEHHPNVDVFQCQHCGVIVVRE